MRKFSGKNRKNRQLAITLRRAKVSELYLTGMSQVEIADKIGTSQFTVSKDLQFLRVQWQQKAMQNIDTIMAEELAQLDSLNRQSRAAYNDSCTKIVDGKPVVTEAGDPRYLAEARLVRFLRLRLLGLIRTDARVTNVVNQSAMVLDWDKLYGPPDLSDLEAIERKIHEPPAHFDRSAAQPEPLVNRLLAPPSTNGNGGQHNGQ